MALGSRLALPDTIKKAVRATGKSVNAVATESGVAQAILQRFLAGKRSITLDTAERICAYLHLELHAITNRQQIPEDD